MGSMLFGLVISLSVLLQFITAFLALRFIRITGWRFSWILISASLFFMGTRRCMTLYRVITGKMSVPFDFSFELVGLITSALMLAGVWLLGPVFRSIKQTEEDVQNSEAKYRSLVESTDDSIYLVDRDYRYLFINKKHLARMGISGSAYLGRSYGDFHSQEITEAFAATAKKVFETGESVQHEHKSERDNEYFLFTLSPVKDPNGTTTAVTVVSKKITELKRLEDNLRALSLTDELTGLYNRRGFLTLADQHIRVAKRLKNKVYMLYTDVDDLKVINDSSGHRQGDLALIDIASILKETYRESDIIARIGGDEFAVMPVGNTSDSTEIITARLQCNLDRHNKTMGRGYTLSMSVGIADYDPEHPCSVDELLHEGDRKMYEEKRLRKADLTQ